jgi:hypothetical protein
MSLAASSSSPMMTNDIVLDLNKVDRETALRTWLQYHRIEVKDLAGKLDVHPGTVTRIINGQRASRSLITRLIALGIPEQLLPEPGPGPGRPPGS